MPSTLASVLASSSDSGGSGAILQLGILLLIPFALYFLMIRPQRRRAKEQQQLQGSLQVGDEIITTSGIYGRITGEDGPSRFWVEVDDDVQLRVARAAVQGKVADEAEDDDADEVDDVSSDAAADD
jgi:preprotein translocase subunit YajC